MLNMAKAEAILAMEHAGVYGRRAEGQMLRQKEIIAIGGGKGGVGKSFIASNLGVQLARGYGRTVLVDADLGGANLHTCLGIAPPEATLSDFMREDNMLLEKVLWPTQEENLFLISGAQDFLGIANPRQDEKSRLIRALQAINVDYIVLDLGAGTSNNTLDFFLAADKGVLVVQPEPTSIENAYRFVKSTLYRKLRRLASASQVRSAIEKAMDRRNDLGIRSPLDLIRFVNRIDPESGGALEEALREFRPSLVMNQVRSQHDVRVGKALCNACEKFFGLDVDFIGYLESDELIWQSIRKRQPVLIHHGDSRSARNLRSITYNLVHGLPMR